MVTNLQPTTIKTDHQIMATLLASHGDLNLAAERLNLTPNELFEKIPNLDTEALRKMALNARILQTFDMFHIMKNVVLAQLAELDPVRASKFFIEFMDRYETVLNPPVQGGAPANANQINLNFGDTENARSQLAARIVEVTASGAETSSSESDEPAGSSNPPVRLGTPS